MHARTSALFEVRKRIRKLVFSLSFSLTYFRAETVFTYTYTYTVAMSTFDSVSNVHYFF